MFALGLWAFERVDSYDFIAGDGSFISGQVLCADGEMTTETGLWARS